MYLRVKTCIKYDLKYNEENIIEGNWIFIIFLFFLLMCRKTLYGITYNKFAIFWFICFSYST